MLFHYHWPKERTAISMERIMVRLKLFIPNLSLINWNAFSVRFNFSNHCLRITESLQWSAVAGTFCPQRCLSSLSLSPFFSVFIYFSLPSVFTSLIHQICLRNFAIIRSLSSLLNGTSLSLKIAFSFSFSIWV